MLAMDSGGTDILGPNWTTLELATSLPDEDGAGGNSSSPAGLEQQPDCLLFVFINYVVIFGTICIFGLVGNSLSLVVMVSERGSHVARFLLEVMAVTDNCFLAMAGFAQIVQATLIFAGDGTNPILAYSAVIVWPLVHTTQMASVWMVVLVAFNRYVAICRPFQAPMLCTRKRVRLQIAAIIAFVVIYNIPRFFEHHLVYDVLSVSEDGTNTVTYYLTYNETALKQSAVYNIVYENVLYSFFVFLGPLAVLITMNTCLIRELAHVRQRLVKQNLPISGEEDENGLTMTMIVIILVFIVCQTPAFFNQMLFLAIGDTHCIPCLPYYYYYQLSNVLVSTNSSANFVIYCAFRRQFRDRLKRLCLSCYPRWLRKRHISQSNGCAKARASKRNRKFSSYVDNDDVTSVSLAGINDIRAGGYLTACNSHTNYDDHRLSPSCCLELYDVTAPLNPKCSPIKVKA